MSPVFAIAVLIDATALTALALGVAVAQLMRANEAGKRGLRVWLLSLGSFGLLYVWAHVAGASLNTPGVHDNFGLLAAALAVVFFFCSFIPHRRALQRQGLRPPCAA